MKRFKELKIAVLMGGPSSERDISLKSGKDVLAALQSKNCDVIGIDANGNFLKTIKEKNIAVVFIALHGRFGEDGTVQKMLDKAATPYTGSGPRASSIALNKRLSRKIFQKNSIPFPRYIAIEKKQLKNKDKIFAVLKKHKLDNFPLVVKPSSEGSSIGLSIIKEESAFIAALNCAFEYGEFVIIEEYIRGREITAAILDGRPLPIVEIAPKRSAFFDFAAKYTAGLTEYIVPAKISLKDTKNSQAIALAAYNAIDCQGFGRVDMILRDDGPVVLELNSIPGLTSTSLFPKAAAACGISFSELCLKLIEIALKDK